MGMLLRGWRGLRMFGRGGMRVMRLVGRGSCLVWVRVVVVRRKWMVVSVRIWIEEEKEEEKEKERGRRRRLHRSSHRSRGPVLM